MNHGSFELKPEGDRTQAGHILSHHLYPIGQAMIEIVGWQIQLIIHVYLDDPFCEGDENRKTFPVYHTEEAGTEALL
jgi:hypothetical protein